ncbi:hypothetical protein ACFPME_01140 [Rhodanobacter umsongensis]|uniref:Uncharacterized protein n=1 Tax=Rhodanobacter umsongensis TaxID=633153 RepID=A0ABW0JH70_9GAMM
MEIIRNGSQPSVTGPVEYFTGKVRIDSSFKGMGGASVSGASVTSSRVRAVPGTPIRWGRR